MCKGVIGQLLEPSRDWNQCAYSTESQFPCSLLGNAEIPPNQTCMVLVAVHVSNRLPTRIHSLRRNKCPLSNLIVVLMCFALSTVSQLIIMP